MLCKCKTNRQERVWEQYTLCPWGHCVDRTYTAALYLLISINKVVLQCFLTFVDIVEIVDSFSRSSFLSFSISVLAWWISASLAEFSLCSPFSKVVDCIFCLFSFSLSLVNWAILRSFSAISVRKEAILFVVAFGSVLAQVVALGYNETIAFLLEFFAHCMITLRYGKEENFNSFN